MRASKITEKQLASHLVKLLPDIGLVLLEQQVTLGKFRLDAVARDEKTGALVVIELKTRARLDTLAQLLLYPHALAKIVGAKRSGASTIRAALITTHLDLNVVEVAKSITPPHEIELWVCVGRKKNEYKLVPPSQARDQCWDQAECSKEQAKTIRARFLEYDPPRG